MHRSVATDAQGVAFNLPSALKSIKDNLIAREVKALKFLCSDFISPRTMEGVNSALSLFVELKKLEITPLNIAELLYIINQNRLIPKLQYTVEDVIQIVDEGKGFCKPCRVLLYRISEHITNDQLDDLHLLCPQISRAAMEKIKDPLDFFQALERLNLINVCENNLESLKEILSDAGFVKEVKLIDQLLHKQRNKPVNALSSSTSQGSHHPNPQNSVRSNRNPVTLRSSYEATTSNSRNLNVSQPAPVEFNIPGHAGEPSSLCTFSTICACTEDAPPDGQIAGQAAGAIQCENSDDFYPMTHDPRGICLIINNEQFHGDKPLRAREGSNIDCRLMENIFQNELKFNVKVCQNLTDDEIFEELRRTASEDHSAFDCFVCFIFSHGEEGSVFGANGKPLQLKHVTGCFVPGQCRSLCKKPKLFFIQACQGDSYPEACQIQTDSEIDDTDARSAPSVGVAALPESIPHLVDFFICLSTVPGYVSFRSASHGSWFIMTLGKLLREYAASEDLNGILTRVKCEISRAAQQKDGRVCKQVPMSTNTLRKKVKFL